MSTTSEFNDVLISRFCAFGRVLLAMPFLLAGPDKIAHADAAAGFMASGGLPDSPVLAVVVGCFELVAGLALVAGCFTRWSASALAIFTAVATHLFHAYWLAPPEVQAVQQLLFSKNLGIFGGLLFVAAIGPGAWSWDAWRSGQGSTLDRGTA